MFINYKSILIYFIVIINIIIKKYSHYREYPYFVKGESLSIRKFIIIYKINIYIYIILFISAILCYNKILNLCLLQKTSTFIV